jgi:hypothetical protein
MRRPLLILSLLTISTLTADAAVLDLPPSLAPQVLSESVPFVFTPAEFSAEDYKIEWQGVGIPDVKLSLGLQSLQWVRVSKYFVIPRAVLVVEAREEDQGVISHNGFSHTLHKGQGQIPVALISGEKNPVEIRVRRNGKELVAKALIRFSPRPENERRALIDTSCSPYAVDVDQSAIPVNSWMYIGCRIVYARGPTHPIATLEMLVFWDNVGQEIKAGDVSVSSSSVSVWTFRLRNQPAEIQLASPMGRAKVSYRVAERLRMAHLGFGIGPYAYHYEGGSTQAKTIVPLITLYGSYFINESMRFVVFEASPLHSTIWSDTGLYFHVEQIRTIDERFSLSFLLGAHFLAHPYNGSWYGRMSAPQGVEMVFRDFVRNNHSVSLGAFLYPPIKDTSYYNIWARWGSPSLFIEFNYINWRQKIYNDVALSRAMGISVGMPLKHFF